MVYALILLLIVAIAALIFSMATGKNRYSEMTEEEFEAEAKRNSLSAAAVLGLQKVLEPNKVEYILQRDKRVEGEHADSGDRPPDEAPVPAPSDTTGRSPS